MQSLFSGFELPGGLLRGALKGGLLAADEIEGMGVAGFLGHGEGEAGGLVDAGVFRVDGLGLAVHFVVEEGGFDAPEAAHAPPGGDQFFELEELVVVGGRKMFEVGGEEGVEAVLGLVGEDERGSGEARVVRDAVLRK